MGKAGAYDHAKDEDRGIAVTFTRQEELTPRASPCQGEGKTGQDHAPEIPNAHGVRYRLVRKAGMELPHNQVGDECEYRKGDKP